MQKILKAGTTLAVALVAFAVAVPAQALITNADIASNAGISYSKLKLGGKIDSGDIKDGSIQGKDIKKGTITESKIKDGAITADKIADGTLTATTLADGSVTSAKILDGTITGDDLASDIEINTTGDATIGGVLTMDSSYLTDSTGTIDIGRLTGTPDTIDLNGDTTVDGNVLPAVDATNTLGGASTRWATIYADALNYKTALTDGSGSGVSTVTLGTTTADLVTIAGAIQGATPLVFDGATAGTNMTTLTVTDPTGANAITLPNASGTIVLTGSTGTVSSAMITDGVIAAADIAAGAVTAPKLQSAAADLGAADVTVNFGNTNGSFNTNITTDGTITASDHFIGNLTGAVTGNASTATSATSATTATTATNLSGGTVAATTASVGSGTTITKIVVYAPSLTPAATAAAIGTTQQTFTVTGLDTADKIIVNGPVPTSLCPMVGARVSATDTLQLNFATLTALACTPAAGTYNIVAIRN